MTDRHPETAIETGLLRVEELFGMSGMEYFQGVIAGGFPYPPITGVIPMTFIETSPGKPVLTARSAPRFSDPLGTTHAGLTATPLGTAAACVVHASLAADGAYTTPEIKCTLHRAVTPEPGELRVEGNMVSRGRRIAASKSSVIDGKGRIPATATGTCIIKPLLEVTG